MAAGITSIGPLAIDKFIYPITITLAGPPNVRGIPATISTTLMSRTLAEQVAELVNNPCRRQQIAGTVGVLEWVETTAPLDRWRGWWLLSFATLTYTQTQFVLDASEAYLPIEIGGVYLGAAGTPQVVATHRARANGFGLAGQPLVPGLYPGASTNGDFWRVGFGSVGINLKKSADKRRSLIASQIPTTAACRPALTDPNGLAHFGGRPDFDPSGWYAGGPLVRTKCSSGLLIVEGVIPGYEGAWTRIGTLLPRSDLSVASHAWRTIGAKVTDDAALLRVQNDYDNAELTIKQVASERGVRLLSSEPLYFDWAPRLTNATGVIAYAAGKYGNGLNATVANAPDVRHQLHREFEGTKPVTICGWYKPAAAIGADIRRLASLTTTASGAGSYIYFRQPVYGSQNLAVERWDGGAIDNNDILGLAFNAGDLIFWALRYDGATLKASGKVAAGALVHGAGSAAVAPLAAIERLSIGGYGGAGVADGVVDNVMVFNRSLTDAELGAIANGAAFDAGLTSATLPNLAFFVRLDGDVGYRGPVAISANAYGEQSWEALGPGSGSFRCLALLNAATSVDLANWRVQTAEAFAYFVPDTGVVDDTMPEQAKQFVYDRTALVTLG